MTTVRSRMRMSELYTRSRDFLSDFGTIELLEILAWDGSLLELRNPNLTFEPVMTRKFKDSAATMLALHAPEFSQAGFFLCNVLSRLSINCMGANKESLETLPKLLMAWLALGVNFIVIANYILYMMIHHGYSWCK